MRQIALVLSLAVLAGCQPNISTDARAPSEARAISPTRYVCVEGFLYGHFQPNSSDDRTAMMVPLFDAEDRMPRKCPPK